MNEQIQRALEDLATRGRDPGAATVVQHALEAAPKRRRRQRMRRVTAGVTVVVAVTGVAIAVESSSSAPHQVVVATPTTASSLSSASTFSLNPEVSGCFSVPASAPAGPVAPSIGEGTDASSRLLVLTNDGALWVLEGRTATLWSGTSEDAQYSPIVWARWLADGSILAARVGNADVELDRFSAPDQSAPLAHLPYTIKADAPAGSCPTNGYLATFGVVDAGVVVLRHAAGPIRHSCPPGAPSSACTSPEEYSTEVRAPQRLDAVGRPTGDSAGGFGEIVSTSRDMIVIDEGYESITMRVGPTSSLCCFGGQSGTAFALSPDAASLAYARKPAGRDVFVASVGENTPGQQLGTPLWKAADSINALAWSGDTIAAVHGNQATFIAVPAGAPVGEATFATAIRTIDYERR